MSSSACPFIVPPPSTRPEVFIQKKGDSDLSVCLTVSSLTPHSPSLSITIAALYNPRNKSYLSPETNYHYGNSPLLSPTRGRRTSGGGSPTGTCGPSSPSPPPMPRFVSRVSCVAAACVSANSPTKRGSAQSLIMAHSLSRSSSNSEELEASDIFLIDAESTWPHKITI